MDKIFYWARSGKQATVIELSCSLAEDVDPQALKIAATKALEVHTNFRIRPLVIGNGIKAVIDDVKIPPVYPKDGRPRRLGTDETEGLMLYAAYADKEITLRVFHGVADLHGIYAFLKTLLKFYYSCLGAADIELPEPDSIDTAPLYEAVLQKGSAAPPSGIYTPSEHEIFHLPEESFVGQTTRQRVFGIDVPLEPLLTLAKESGSSVVPTLQAIVGHAIHKTYDVGEKDVVGYTPDRSARGLSAQNRRQRRLYLFDPLPRGAGTV